MKKSGVSKDLFILSLLTVLTVLTWIAFDAYRAFKKSDIPKVLQKQMEPLNSQLNTQVLEKLATRTKIEKGELLLPLATPTPTEGQ